jgi:hypothetical protein
VGWNARPGLAAALWLVLAVLVWNDVFDAVIINAARDYLNRKALFLSGSGGDVTVFGAMRPAAARGAWLASAWAAPIVAVGLAGTWYGSRRVRRTAVPGDHGRAESVR